MMKQAIEGRLIAVTDTHYITETTRGRQSWHMDYYRLSADDYFIPEADLQEARKMTESGEISSAFSFILGKIKNAVDVKQLGQRRKPDEEKLRARKGQA